MVGGQCSTVITFSMDVEAIVQSGFNSYFQSLLLQLIHLYHQISTRASMKLTARVLYSRWIEDAYLMLT